MNIFFSRSLFSSVCENDITWYLECVLNNSWRTGASQVEESTQQLTVKMLHSSSKCWENLKLHRIESCWVQYIWRFSTDVTTFNLDGKHFCFLFLSEHSSESRYGLFFWGFPFLNETRKKWVIGVFKKD